MGANLWGRQVAVAHRHVGHTLARLLLESALEQVRQEQATAHPESEKKKLPAGKTAADGAGSRGSDPMQQEVVPTG